MNRPGSPLSSGFAVIVMEDAGVNLRTILDEKSRAALDRKNIVLKRVFDAVAHIHILGGDHGVILLNQLLVDRNDTVTIVNFDSTKIIENSPDNADPRNRNVRAKYVDVSNDSALAHSLLPYGITPKMFLQMTYEALDRFPIFDRAVDKLVLEERKEGLERAIQQALRDTK